MICTTAYQQYALKSYDLEAVDYLLKPINRLDKAIQTVNQKLITAMNLETIHQKINEPQFIRVSKSYVVNTVFIESFDNHTIYVGGVEIPIGEVYKNEFLERYTGRDIRF